MMSGFHNGSQDHVECQMCLGKSKPLSYLEQSAHPKQNSETIGSKHPQLYDNWRGLRTCSHGQT